ncbi:MerR family transcriptional regulator [uncultured Shimia sp.]|uniref:MerR family transcriptional regulator n=1 Tax=uncultured Shimia sp. TaxID=573152 RepID=UPI00260C2BBD|nr:MerR family transcriptional regulator [uncultured Shimia sp.]
MGKSKDAFRTISEVADWLDTQAHVLRFWESKFSQVKPVKRAGGRRYYRPADMRLLGGIKKLLHDDGMTIKGAQKLLREKGIKHVSALSQPLDDEIEEKTVAATVETEVQPPEISPAEVLEFAKPTEAPEVDEEDLSEVAGDLFPVQAASKAEGVQDQDTATEPSDDTSAPTPEDLPSQDEMPAFLQRVTFDTVSDAPDEIKADDAAPVESDDNQGDASEDSVAPTADAIAAKIASDTPAPEAKNNKQSEQTNMEPGKSLLPDVVATHAIDAKNRSEVGDLLTRLAALRERIAETGNA